MGSEKETRNRKKGKKRQKQVIHLARISCTSCWNIDRGAVACDS